MHQSGHLPGKNRGHRAIKKVGIGSDGQVVGKDVIFDAVHLSGHQRRIPDRDQGPVKRRDIPVPDLTEDPLFTFLQGKGAVSHGARKCRAAQRSRGPVPEPELLGRTPERVQQEDQQKEDSQHDFGECTVRR